MTSKKPVVYIARVEWCPYEWYMNEENERLLASFATVRNNGNVEEVLTHEKAVEHLKGAHGILALNGSRMDELTAKAVQEADTVQVASVSHFGFDGCAKSMEGVKILMIDTSFPCSQSVAEWSLGAIIAGLRKFDVFDRQMKNGGKWPSWQGTAGQLNGGTVGLVGVGRIGKCLLKYLRAFECRKLAYDPLLSKDDIADMGAEKATLQEVLRESDAVSLHAPVIPETKAMIGAKELKMMKDGALLVNSARAWLLDNDAFRAELKTGRIRAYLDVFAPEPPEPDDLLRTLDNVVMTPHVAGTTELMFHRCGRFAIEALRDHFEKHPVQE